MKRREMKHEIPNELFEWLGSFKFDELSAYQQAIVQLYISQQEYDELYDTIAGVKNVDLDSISATGKLGKESIIRKVISMKMPIYQAAMALLLVGCLFWMFIRGDSIVIPVKTNYLEQSRSLADDPFPDSLIFEL